MLFEYALIHAGVCSVVFLVAYFFVGSRWLWYTAAGLFALNIIWVAAYFLINSITGNGFNEAVLYYILNASWKDVILLTAYDEVLYAVPVIVLVLGLFFYGVIRARLPKFLPASVGMQLFLVFGGAAMGGIMSPLTEEVSLTATSAGMNKIDHIDLPNFLAANSVPERLIGSKKNLIVIYSESLEWAFFDESLFPGLMPKLNALSAQGVVFEGIQQAPMSEWTIAGMIATQCGVPLSSHRLRNESNDFGKFAGGYNCLSDYLGKQGFWRVYIGGASSDFAGKGRYYETMNFEEIFGLEKLSNPNSPLSKWGIYDDELLPLVRQKIGALRVSNHLPFALVTLTLDSHPPEGFASPACKLRGVRYGRGDVEHLNALRCTDEILGDFLEQTIRENIHDSTIVLLSDHLMMNSQAREALSQKSAPRRNRMVIWDKALTPRAVGRTASQFDVAPTILQVLLGRSYQVGFGSSILDSQPNLSERYGSRVFDESVYAWRTDSWKKW